MGIMYLHAYTRIIVTWGHAIINIIITIAKIWYDMIGGGVYLFVDVVF